VRPSSSDAPHISSMSSQHSTTGCNEHAALCCNAAPRVATGQRLPKDAFAAKREDVERVGRGLSRHRRTGAPHLHRDWARPRHICAGTGLAPAHICARTGLTLTPAAAARRPGRAAFCARCGICARAGRVTRRSSSTCAPTTSSTRTTARRARARPSRGSSRCSTRRAVCAGPVAAPHELVATLHNALEQPRGVTEALPPGETLLTPALP
jgi:hypothetical protein